MSQPRPIKAAAVLRSPGGAQRNQAQPRPARRRRPTDSPQHSEDTKKNTPHAVPCSHARRFSNDGQKLSSSLGYERPPRPISAILTGGVRCCSFACGHDPKNLRQRTAKPTQANRNHYTTSPASATAFSLQQHPQIAAGVARRAQAEARAAGAPSF